jgi:uncharacterized protein with FMN-binding domain
VTRSMPNVSRSEPRPPTMLPRRGLAAFALTIGGVALLISFHTPDPGALSFQPAGGGGDSGAAPLGGVVMEDSSPDTAALLSSDPPPGDPAAGAADPAADTAAPAPTSEPTPASRSGRQHNAVPNPTPAPTPAPTPKPAPRTQTITGQTVSTPFGFVQVRITVTGGRIMQIQPLLLPSGLAHSTRLSRYAAPILHDEALQAQSAHIGLVSGATYTSQGYEMSLQSAIDRIRA